MPILLGQNLIPNGGFESCRNTPMKLGDFYPTDWYSIASGSSPDIFSANAPLNSTAHPNWYYSNVAPIEGSSYAGIILAEKKTTYREYIGIRLNSKLQEDSVYIFKISVAIPVLSRYTSNTLDIVFTPSMIFGGNGYDILERPANIQVNLDSVKSDGSWYTFQYEYTADGSETHMSIANFKSIKKTFFKEIPNRKKGVYNALYNQIYVAIDDIHLYKKNNNNPVNDKITIPDIPIKDKIVINGLNFANGSSEIELNDIPQLQNLVSFLNENMNSTVEIYGYTDNLGNESSNLILSKNRANRIKDYLIENGISENRLVSYGKGIMNPIASNDTEEGRSFNRRIEIVIK